LQPLDVRLARPISANGPAGAAGAQRFQLRACLERRIERAVAGALDVQRIGLRVRGGTPPAGGVSSSAVIRIDALSRIAIVCP
jgi:hypothetical protein